MRRSNDRGAEASRSDDGRDRTIDRVKLALIGIFGVIAGAASYLAARLAGL